MPVLTRVTCFRVDHSPPVYACLDKGDLFQRMVTGPQPPVHACLDKGDLFQGMFAGPQPPVHQLQGRGTKIDEKEPQKA